MSKSIVHIEEVDGFGDNVSDILVVCETQAEQDAVTMRCLRSDNRFHCTVRCESVLTARDFLLKG